MEKICKNCDYAFKRSDFSYKKNGYYHCPLECNKDIDYEMYKKENETCEDWKERPATKIIELIKEGAAAELLKNH